MIYFDYSRYLEHDPVREIFFEEAADHLKVHIRNARQEVKKFSFPAWQSCNRPKNQPVLFTTEHKILEGIYCRKDAYHAIDQKQLDKI